MHVAQQAKCRAQRASPAFTLIELLVVVAILSLLLSILSPTFSRARNMARRTQCQANLYQISTASASYHGANRGWLARIHPATWPGWKPPESPSSATPCYNDALRLYTPNDYIFHCPQAFECANAAKNKRRLDYGINHYGRGENSGKYHVSMDGLRIHQVARCDVIQFSDAENNSSPEDIGAGSRNTLEWPIKWSFERYAHQRHMEGYCNAKLDGTVAWYSAWPQTNEKWFIPKK